MIISRLLLIGLFCVACHGAWSADGPKGITREQAQQLLDTLQDPAKRERFIATLEAYVQALPASGTVLPPAPSSASTPRPAPAARAHGPGPLTQALSWVQAAGTRLVRELRTVTDLSGVSAWLRGLLSDPTLRAAFNEGSLRITLVVAIALGVDALLRWLARRRLRPRGALMRLLGRFGVMIGAALAGNAAILSGFGTELPVARAVAFGVVNTCVAVPFILALLDAFVRSEARTPASGAPAPGLTTGLRSLVVAFLAIVALQLLVHSIADDLAAPETIREALAKLIALIAHGLAILIVLASRARVSGWIRSRSRPGAAWEALTGALAAVWAPVAIFAIAGSWMVWALGVPAAYEAILRLIIATFAVLLASRLLGTLLLGDLDRRMTGFASAAPGSIGARLPGYRHLTRLMVKLLLAAATLLALTEAWGLHSLAWFGEGHPGHRFAAFALQLVVLIVVGIVCWEAADLAFERRVNSLIAASSLPRATRLRTLQPIIRFALLVLIALLVVMTALNAIGINVGPLLAGASIIGVALGFGSQKLVQDFITGIFLLVEDAMDVGDSVTLAGVSGTVEHISIRSIRLRAGDGSVHLVPFSSVTSVNNANRGLGNAAVTVDVDPSADTDRVSAVLADIAREMRQLPEYASAMQSDLQLWGVDKVDGSMVTIAGQIVCTDAGRWAVQREFNRRMKLRLEREGVKLAVPRQTVRIESPGPDPGAPGNPP